MSNANGWQTAENAGDLDVTSPPSDYTAIMDAALTDDERDIAERAYWESMALSWRTTACEYWKIIQGLEARIARLEYERDEARKSAAGLDKKCEKHVDLCRVLARERDAALALTKHGG